MYKIRTVDVWDTLIRRVCHPEAVKLAGAQHIFLRHHSQLMPEISDHWQIYYKRLEIETALAHEAEAAGHDGEYQLNEVIRRLLQVVTRLDVPTNVQTLVTPVLEYELSFEIAHTFPDPEIMTFLEQYPAEETQYLSDFYMGSGMLKRLLAAHGFDRLIGDGLVSCDVMLNKRTGRLFQYVHEQFSIKPSEHIHIGDNPYADVASPKQLGITAISYVPRLPHEKKLSFEATFATRDALFAHMQSKGKALGEGEMQGRAPDAIAAFQLGVEAAPLFIAFAMFVAEQTILDNIDELFFFSREGEFFSRVYDVLFPDLQLAGNHLPQARILEVSRQATFTASLGPVDNTEFDRMWALTPLQPITNLFKILDIEPTAFKTLLGKLGLKDDTLVGSPQQDERIKTLFANEQFRDAVSKSISTRKALLQSYLQQSGVETGKKLGFVDIGWRGTIQDNLALINRGNHTSGYYLALRSFLNKQPSNTKKSAFGPDERREYDTKIFEAFEPLELLCNSDSGSVLGYRKDNDRIVAIRDRDEEENIVFDGFTKHFQDGVTAAAQLYRPLLVSHAVTSTDMRPMALQVWKTLINVPQKQLIAAYYAAPQHDFFGFGGMFDRNNAPSLGKLFAAVFNRKSRQEVIQYIRRTQWTPAVNSLNVGRLNRWALVCVFWMAHRYKTIVLRRKRRV